MTTPSKLSLLPRTPSGKSPGGLLRSAVHFLSSTPLLVSAALGFDLNNDASSSSSSGGGGGGGGGGGNNNNLLQGGGGGIITINDQIGRSNTSALISGTPRRLLIGSQKEGETPLIDRGRGTSRKVMFRDENIVQLGDDLDEVGVIGRGIGEGGGVGRINTSNLLVEEREVDRYLGPGDIFDPHTEGIYKNRAARSLSRELKADAAAEKEFEDGDSIMEAVLNTVDDKIATAIATSAALEAAEAANAELEKINSSKSGKKTTGKRSRKDSDTPSVGGNSISTRNSVVSALLVNNLDEITNGISQGGHVLSRRSKRGRGNSGAPISLPSTSLVSHVEETQVQQKLVVGQEEPRITRVRTRRAGGSATSSQSSSHSVVSAVSVIPLGQTLSSKRRTKSLKSSSENDNIVSPVDEDSASVTVASKESIYSHDSQGVGASRRKTRSKASSQMSSKSSIEEETISVLSSLSKVDRRGTAEKSINPFTEKPVKTKASEKRKRLINDNEFNKKTTLVVVEENVEELYNEDDVEDEDDNSAPGQKRSRLIIETKDQAIKSTNEKTTTDQFVQNLIIQPVTFQKTVISNDKEQQDDSRMSDDVTEFERNSLKLDDSGAGIGLHLLKNPSPRRETEGLWEKSSKHLSEIISIIHTTFHPSDKPRALLTDLISTRAVPVKDSAFRAVSTTTIPKNQPYETIFTATTAKVTTPTEGIRFMPESSKDTSDTLTQPLNASKVLTSSFSITSATPTGQAGRRVHGIGSSLPYMRRKSRGGNILASSGINSREFDISSRNGQSFANFSHGPVARQGLVHGLDYSAFPSYLQHPLQDSRIMTESIPKPIESAESIANKILGALGQLHSPLQQSIQLSQSSIIGSGNSLSRKNVEHDVSRSEAQPLILTEDRKLLGTWPHTSAKNNELQSKSDVRKDASKQVHEHTVRPTVFSPPNHSSRAPMESTTDERNTQPQVKKTSLSRETSVRQQRNDNTSQSIRVIEISKNNNSLMEGSDFGQPKARPRVHITDVERNLIANVEEEIF